jgi:hypothetical protein
MAHNTTMLLQKMPDSPLLEFEWGGKPAAISSRGMCPQKANLLSSLWEILEL